MTDGGSGTKGKTRFVESFSTQQMLPPWKSVGARFWGFVVKVDPECIQDYLDEFFNRNAPDASPYFYAPRDDIHFGLLVVADHSDFTHSKDALLDFGKVSFKEAFWSFPVARYKVGLDNLIRDLPDMVWTQPFGFVDNSYVLFSSREIWGSEKQMAIIGMEEGLSPDDMHIDVVVQGFKKFAPRSRAGNIGVMHIRMKPGTVPVDPWKDIFQDVELAKFTGALAGSIPLDGVSNSSSSITIDTLKQFRDVFDMGAATYRAIVSSSSSQTNGRNTSFYSGKDVELDFMWSDSFARMYEKLFGLKEPDAPTPPIGSGRHGEDDNSDWDMRRSTLPVQFAVSFTADVLFKAEATLHTFGARPFRLPRL